MKKVLLSSVAALAVFAAAAPAFASDNYYSSNALIQKHYVSERDIADEANTQVAAHEADIQAEVNAYPTVVAAQQALDAYGSGHEYEAYKAKVDAARAEAYNIIRNKYVANLQDTYRKAAIASGKYWNDPTGVQDNKTKDMRDAEDKALNHGGSADAANAAGANGQATSEAKSNENKGGDAAKAGKADSKQAGKALPKTSAVK
ncbi:amylase-binding adhesin AbpA [Streptococcus sp. 27098_8_148]|uniref:Amylase-binding protein n=1 Tax=Streptococcus parasanguinis TaxID=1318 RepID=A0AAE8AEP7_STRPA|nr:MULTISPECIES: amylase-binding adhesin AbpA [Streptococcus]MDG3029342.1 amylase-binding adhesin AbpA [Streptococcus sp. ST2]RHN24630.1 amylase-binding protein [Streptococcus parasanguinis]